MSADNQPVVTEGMLKKLAERRFIVTILVLLGSGFMMHGELIEAKNFENIVIWISGIYIIGKPFGDMVGEFLTKK